MHLRYFENWGDQVDNELLTLSVSDDTQGIICFFPFFFSPITALRLPWHHRTNIQHSLGCHRKKTGTFSDAYEQVESGFWRHPGNSQQFRSHFASY